MSLSQDVNLNVNENQTQSTFIQPYTNYAPSLPQMQFGQMPQMIYPPQQQMLAMANPFQYAMNPAMQYYPYQMLFMGDQPQSQAQQLPIEDCKTGLSRKNTSFTEELLPKGLYKNNNSEESSIINPQKSTENTLPHSTQEKQSPTSLNQGHSFIHSDKSRKISCEESQEMTHQMHPNRTNLQFTDKNSFNPIKNPKIHSKRNIIIQSNVNIESLDTKKSFSNIGSPTKRKFSDIRDQSPQSPKTLKKKALNNMQKTAQLFQENQSTQKIRNCQSDSNKKVSEFSIDNSNNNSYKNSNNNKYKEELKTGSLTQCKSFNKNDRIISKSKIISNEITSLKDLENPEEFQQQEQDQLKVSIEKAIKLNKARQNSKNYIPFQVVKNVQRKKQNQQKRK